MQCCSPTSQTCDHNHEHIQPLSLKLLCWCSAVTFLVGALALIAAWIGAYENGAWYGLKSDMMFFNAIAFFLLSIIADRKREDIERNIMMSMMDEDCCGGCNEHNETENTEKDCCGGGCCEQEKK